jgi:hypothetical protein
MATNMELIIFGFCYIAKETKESFLRLFQNFFQMVRRVPTTIITDEQLAIRHALADLQEANIYDGIHCFDCYHVLKNLKKKTSSKENLSGYRSLLRAKSKAEYEKCLL